MNNKLNLKFKTKFINIFNKIVIEYSGASVSWSASDRYKIYTFDIFDTALTRILYHPDHIHWAVGREIVKRRIFFGTVDDWRNLRITSEGVARIQSISQDISIDQIFEKIQENLSWDNKILDTVKNIEIKMEMKFLSPIATTLNRINYLINNNKNYGFVSDIYFNSFLLKKFLKNNSYKKWDFIISSCDVGLTKYTGDIFKKLLSDLKEDPNFILHSGDNLRGDVFSSTRLGIHSEHFQQSSSNRYEDHIFKVMGCDYWASAFSGTARATRLSNALAGVDRTIWQVSSSVAAPLLTAYCLWVIAEAQRSGVKALFFVARDGQILKKITDNLLRWLNVEIKTVYLMGSRQAFLTPFLATLDAAEREKFLVNASRSSDWRTLFSTLGVSEVELIRWLDKFGPPNYKSKPLLPEDVIRRLLQQHWIIEPLNQHFGQALDHFAAYLRQLGFDSSENIAIVDLGWRGNLQVRLSRCLRHVGFASGANLKGFYYNLRDYPSELDGAVSSFTSKAPCNADLLELFCAADHGSVVGYGDRDGAPEALYSSQWNTDALEWGLKIQQDAIVAFVATLERHAPPDNKEMLKIQGFLPILSGSLLNMFVKCPSSDEALTYGAFVHYEDAEHQVPRDLGPKISLLKYFYMLASRPILVQKNIPWPEGSISRSFPKNKKILMCIYHIKRLLISRIKFVQYVIIKVFLKRR